MLALKRIVTSITHDRNHMLALEKKLSNEQNYSPVTPARLRDSIRRVGARCSYSER